MFPGFRRAAETVWLDPLDPSTLRQGRGISQTHRTTSQQSLQVAGRTFKRRVGTHARSWLRFRLDGEVRRFRA